MFDSIKTFVIYGIQSHEKTILHFKKNGLHRISGDNSNGKSVIMKCMYALFLGEYLNKQGRDALIPWFKEVGVISAESHNGVTLTLVLHLEASKCFYELKYNGTKIRKSLSDDYKTLLKVANFHYLQDEKFSLNRYKTKTTLPFTHTSGTLNHKLLDSASEVPQVKELISILDLQLSEVKLDRENIERKIISLSEQLKTMDDTGITELEGRIKYVETLYNSYNKIKPLKLAVDSINDSNNKIKELNLNDFSLTEPLLEQLKLIEKIKESLDSVNSVNEKINELSKDGIEEPIDLTKYVKMLNIISSLSLTNKNIYDSTLDLSKKKDFDFVDIGSIITVQHKLRKLSSVFKTIEESNDIIQKAQKVKKPIPLDRITNQLNLLIELNSLSNNRIKTTSELSEVKRNLSILDNDINSLSKEIGICKHCGNILTENHHHNIG